MIQLCLLRKREHASKQSAAQFQIISQLSPHQSTETSTPHQIPCFPPIPLLQALSEAAASAGDINLTS